MKWHEWKKKLFEFVKENFGVNNLIFLPINYPVSRHFPAYENLENNFVTKSDQHGLSSNASKKK